MTANLAAVYVFVHSCSLVLRNCCKYPIKTKYGWEKTFSCVFIDCFSEFPLEENKQFYFKYSLIQDVPVKGLAALAAVADVVREGGREGHGDHDVHGVPQAGRDT